MSEVLLTCRDVNKAYGGVQAVRDASLELRRGEILGLVGPNGAGKTTLVDVITGQQRADSGLIEMGGHRMAGPPSKRARLGRFARTFQNPQLALDLTVRENILIGCAAERMETAPRIVASAFLGLFSTDTTHEQRRIEQVASELNLTGIDRLCSDLTLGEQRLVEVARAVVRDPDVILLDEPFAGGDAHGVAGVTDALQHLLGQGCGVLVVDHNVDIVASLVHRIVLMDGGRIVFDGDPKECLASPEMQRVYFGSGDASR